MDKKKIKNSTISLVRGDITLMETDAFVFHATEDLKLGSGYGGAIAVRGGPKIQEALDKMGNKEVGDAVITEAGNLKAKYIIHTVAPKFQEEDLEGKLKKAMENTLKLAEEKGDIKTISFPPMGTGLYAIPLDMCANTMFNTVIKHLEGDTKIEEVVFCVLDTREFKPFDAKLNSI